mmetsp:Transcript_11945/g.35902  ORF Transcript_11945/g.35902 Transcript_11945/m.35902 type:complete len:99 (+) Transcript_11945:1880-2176(+)
MRSWGPRYGDCFFWVHPPSSKRFSWQCAGQSQPRQCILVLGTSMAQGRLAANAGVTSARRVDARHRTASETPLSCHIPRGHQCDVGDECWRVYVALSC